MAARDSIKKFNQHLGYLNNIFKPWENLYKDIRQNIEPYAGWIPDQDTSYDPNENDNRYNPDVTRAAKVHGNGMQAGLCSKSRQWFQLGTDDPDLESYPQVKEWLDHGERWIYRVLSNSNFYAQQQEGLYEQGVFGMENLFPEERTRAEGFVHFHRFPAGSYRVAADKDGNVNTCYRPVKMCANVLAEWFGRKALSQNAQNALKNNPYDMLDVVHVITPRKYEPSFAGDPSSTAKAWASVWYEAGESDRVLRESGFDYYPFVTPRYRTVSPHAYGIGPGIDCIKRIKFLQQAEKDSIRAFHREAFPPLTGPARYANILNLTPDAYNPYTGTDPGKIESIYNHKVDWQHYQFRLDAILKSAEKTFMVDLFLMLLRDDGSDPQRTATEILRRYEEKMTMLGPVVEQQTNENFDPVIGIVFNIIQQKGVLPPPPEELANSPQLKVKYISPLAQAQKMVEMQKLDVFEAWVTRIAQWSPDVVHAVSEYDMLKSVDTAVGTPTKILLSADQYGQKLERIQDLRRQQAEMDQLSQASQAAHSLGGAQMEGSALGMLAEQGMA